MVIAIIIVVSCHASSPLSHTSAYLHTGCQKKVVQEGVYDSISVHIL